jgi:hypothetical protein
MNKNKGSSLPQYVIIIALVALVLVPVLIIMGKNISDYFKNFKESITVEEVAPQPDLYEVPVVINPVTGKTVTEMLSSETSSEAVNAGSLGGTPAKPVTSCEGNLCDIDYGDFMLHGVPSNMDEFYESSGSSGVTEILSSLVAQIALNIEPGETKVDISLLKKLADRGHEIAGHERKLEDVAKAFLDNPDQFIVTDFAMPSANLDQGTSRGFFDLYLSQINSQLANPQTETDKAIKAIVNLLAGEINTLADHMAALGKDVPSGYDVPVEVVQKILEPNASTETDLRSAIICATGKGEDTGVQCN